MDLEIPDGYPDFATATNQPTRPQNSPSGAMVRLVPPLHPYYHSAVRNVRFGSLADILQYGSYVRFTPESGHVQRTSPCPLCANSGHFRREDQFGPGVNF